MPESKTENYPQIPWKEISGFRNILVHDYLGDIDAKTVLNVVENHVDPLKEAVDEMLKEGS